MAECQIKTEGGASSMRQNESFQVKLYKLVHGEADGWFSRFLLRALEGLAALYGFGVRAKLSLYRAGLLRRHRLPCKVISLGNITVGGTGKTPTAQSLASYIHKLGYRVVILNRGYRAGYKGKVGLVSDGKKIYMSVSEAGDEAYLLAKNLPGVPVVIGRQRSESGEYAVRELRAEVIIMDDGYQHWQLERDLDIVLIDTINVFGNNFLLPRGTLREPLTHLNRAQAVLLTKADQSSDCTREAIKETVSHYNPQALIVESVHNPNCFIEIEEWYKGVRTKNTAPLETVRGKQITALSAIGNPSSFEQTITDIGAQVVYAARYPDHHTYTMAEMQYVMQRAVDCGSTAIITTEKDAVKIPSEFIHSDRPLPLYVLGIEVWFTEGYPELMALIADIAASKIPLG